MELTIIDEKIIFQEIAGKPECNLLNEHGLVVVILHCNSYITIEIFTIWFLVLQFDVYREMFILLIYEIFIHLSYKYENNPVYLCVYLKYKTYILLYA